jgi:putative membrane protein
MLKALNSYKRPFSVFLIWLFVLSALIGISMGYVSWFIPKKPLKLVLGAVLLFLNFPINNAKSLAVWCFAFFVGMTVEIIGVKTGVLFGEYYYGDNLGAKLMGVPYLIGVYWAVLSFITAAIGRKWFTSPFPSALVGAGLMVFLDVFIEQLASEFDFWHFKDGIVPMRNYLTWFVVAFLLEYLLLKSFQVRDFQYSLHLFLSQLAFFGGCLLLLG